MKHNNVFMLVFALGLLLIQDPQTASIVCRVGLGVCALTGMIDQVRDYQIRKLRVETENKKVSQ